MLKIVSGDLSRIDTTCLVILVCENSAIYSHPLICDLIQRAQRINEFKGKTGDELFLYEIGEGLPKRILFLGIGNAEKVDREALRCLAGKSLNRCIKRNLTEMTLCIPDGSAIPLDNNMMLEALAEGACLANYIFNRYKKEKKKPLKQVAFYIGGKSASNPSKICSTIETVCSGTVLAREWVNMPPNDKRPEKLAQSIHKEAEKQKIKITVFDEKMLQKSKMGGILAVGSGSQNRPRMIILDYNPKKAGKIKKETQTIALVGKGVTFDSGGINLKPSDGLVDMKMDMSGAAAVAATLITIAKLKMDFRVVGLIPVVENMPSGGAARPGDIIESFSGKTVEIGNTDAEGRLILMDAISYAEKTFAPHVIIDLATLTGACVVALGEKIAGVFSKNKQLTDAIIASGENTYERCWAMPMPDDYKEMLKSDFADIKNVSSTRWGGAITGALFLSEFVKDTPWAHIDIAGPAFSRKKSDYCGPGGTGFGVRLIIDVINNYNP